MDMTVTSDHTSPCVNSRAWDPLILATADGTRSRDLTRARPTSLSSRTLKLGLRPGIRNLCRSGAVAGVGIMAIVLL